MKSFLTILSSLLLTGLLGAADLSRIVAEISKYESGVSAEPLRQMERAVRESIGHPADRAEVEAALVQLLASSSTFEARRFVCGQLAVISTDTSLAAVAERLRDPDTVGMACLALGSNPSPKVNELLRAALASTLGLARVQVVATLGNRRDTVAVGPLAQLARGEDSEAGEAALGALGKIGSAEALAVLGPLRSSGNPERARAAVLASLVGADQAAQRGEGGAATAIFNDLMAVPQPVPVRRAALEGLFRLDEDGGEKRALAVLRGADPAMKPCALARVPLLKSGSASARFAKELSALDSAGQVQLLEALAIRNDSAARLAITGQVTAEDPTVRRAAVVALASVGDAKSVPVLIRALGATTNAEAQQTIEMVLASLKGGRAVDEQIAALLDGKPSAPKPILINVLARRGNHASVKSLLGASEGSDPATVRAAFRALGRIGTPEDLAAVLDKLASLKVPEVRGEAEGAASRILARSPDENRRFAAVSHGLEAVTEVETRCALVGLLPACGGAKALEAVKTARADTDARVREAALRALAAWPDASAIDTLIEVARSTTDQAERVTALRGCIYLLENAGEFSSSQLAARFDKVMPLTQNANERKLIISGLAKVHDPLALRFLDSFLSDTAVQAEAAQALLSLAPSLCGAFREATTGALQKITNLPIDEELKKPARALLIRINAFGDFLMGWQVAGPFSVEGKDGKALFDVAFPPEDTAGPQAKWQMLPAGAVKSRPWQLDLGALFTGDNRVAYARAWVHSDAQQTAVLELGSDDGIKAWVNGKVVISANRGGDVAPGSEKGAVTLQEGWNSVLLKVTQWSAGWGFCARLAKPDGSALTGMRIAVNPPQ